ncbi:putative odorant receptor 92a [Maniola hyperantus]|uniref:putative odorant receptor 92a n=1 Tax=Aphantopus hyperantus TaxID=2795564 RepID=UPI0015692409|nr:uncharacterized protein LOC117986872 [Maniola hyperantus]
MLLLVFTALGLLCLSFYHGLDIFDIPFLTEAGNYILILSYKLLIQFCSKVHVSDYHRMQRSMQEDFLFICTRGEKYRKRFFQHQIETRKVLKLTIIFTMGVACGMNCFSASFLIYHLLTHEPGKGKRPLLFPFWYFETDFSKTPIYEMAFIFSSACVIAYAFNYTFMIGTQIVWIRQIVCKADIIIWHIEDVMVGIRPTNNKRERETFDHLIRQRMKNIVQHHNLMNTLTEQFARVYKKLLMFEQILSAPVVCFSAYSAAESWDEGQFNAILIMILFAAVILLFIPSYLCTTLSLKIHSISYACWNIPFWNAGPVIRPYLVLIMQRSLKPLPLKVPGFEEFSMQTFSNKMASAYSFFNMLRQANKK